MNEESVSVVIPTHNAAAFLAEAVASIRAQTRPVDEILVVDDGSTDGTAGVIAAMGGNVRAVRQERAGAGAARNRGAELARGSWLAFLDADDLWVPGKLACQLAWRAERPETEIIFGQGCNFSAEAHGGRRTGPALDAFLPGAALMRRDFFLQRARFSETNGVNDVIEWNLRLRRERVRWGVVPEIVLLRRLHAANSRRMADGGRRGDLQLLRQWVTQRRGE